MALPVDFDAQLKLYTSYYQAHELHTVEDTDKVKVYLLRKPSTMNMHVHLVFTGNRIGLTGDAQLGPTQHGLWSTSGYGVAWFAGALSPSYLCEKFLRQAYDAKATAAHILDRYEEYLKESPPVAKAIVAKLRDLTFDSASSKSVADMLEEVCEDTATLRELVDGSVAYLDYEDIRHTYGELAAPLAAVQQTFARLYGTPPSAHS
jgi:hypothetical protein